MVEVKKRLVGWVPQTLEQWYVAQAKEESRSTSSLITKVLSDYADKVKETTNQEDKS